MIDIQEYMRLSRDARRNHLRLSDPCVIRGGNSFQMRGLLAHVLDTTIPPPRNGRLIVVCHACHNPECGNPYHLYWGNNSDNRIDSIENGGIKNAYYYNVKNHGVEYANSVNIRNKESASKSGKGNKGTKKSPSHKSRISDGVRAFYARRSSEK
jgi:hypothetical protein